MLLRALPRDGETGGIYIDRKRAIYGPREPHHPVGLGRIGKPRTSVTRIIYATLPGGAGVDGVIVVVVTAAEIEAWAWIFYSHSSYIDRRQGTQAGISKGKRGVKEGSNLYLTFHFGA